MNRKDVKAVVQYYYEIPNMARMLDQERETLEGEYNALGSVNMDGMPHGATPGKPVEALALKTAAAGVWDRLREIDVRRQVLDGDEAAIREALDGMAGRYKRLLSMRYQYRYSWAKISIRLGVPDSTARGWHEKAILVLGHALDDGPMAGEILGRASRARV